MIDDNEKQQILQSIALEGSSLDENKSVNLIIASRSHLNHVLDNSSGTARLRHSVVNKFVLILSQPLILKPLSSLSIRCCLCGKIISYPAWYHSVSYVTNHLHYFICFDRNSHNKPNAKCYRRF